MIKLKHILNEVLENNLKGTWINKKSGQRWRVDYVYEEDEEVVLVKLTGKPLTKIITIKSLLKNWEKND